MFLSILNFVFQKNMKIKLVLHFEHQDFSDHLLTFNLFFQKN